MRKKKGAKNDYYEQMAWLVVIYWQSDLFFSMFIPTLSCPLCVSGKLQNKYKIK